MTEFFVGEKEKWTNTGTNLSNMWLILCYTVQLVMPDVCTKFQDPKSSGFRETFDRQKS